MRISSRISSFVDISHYEPVKGIHMVTGFRLTYHSPHQQAIQCGDSITNLDISSRSCTPEASYLPCRNRGTARQVASVRCSLAAVERIHTTFGSPAFVLAHNKPRILFMESVLLPPPNYSSSSTPSTSQSSLYSSFLFTSGALLGKPFGYYVKPPSRKKTDL